MSGPARTLVVRLMRSKAVWTVDNVARLIQFLKILIFILSVAYDPEGSQNLIDYKTLLYLFIYYMTFKTFNPASCKTGCKEWKRTCTVTHELRVCQIMEANWKVQ